MPLSRRYALNRRWLWSAAISLVVCALWFAYGMTKGRCWLYSPYNALENFLIAWLSLLLFFGFRIKGRLLLLGLALMVVMFWANVNVSSYAAAQAGAVGRLRQLHDAMEDYKSKHQSYPVQLPQVASNWPVEKHYRFELVPSRSTDDAVTDYLIQAIPLHHPCPEMRSFSVASDGRIFYTLEPRAATVEDQVLQ